MLNQRSDKLELLRIAEAVATEKSIDKEIILTSMESAIQKAAKTRFGSDNNIRAIINRETGDISLHKVLKIVLKPENLEHITNIFFNQRRKMIKKPMKFLFKNFEYIAKSLSLDLNLRPQNISNQIYYKICYNYEKSLK